MTFWIPIVLFFGIWVAYGLLTDPQQVEWESAANQWSIVLMAWGWFLSVSYKNTTRKAVVFILLMWSLLVAATDGFISWYPTWLMIVEAFFFAGLTVMAVWKIYAAARD